MKQLKALIFLTSLTSFFVSATLLNAQLVKDTSKSIYKPITISKDNLIAAALDSLALQKCFDKYAVIKANKKPNNYSPDFVPTFSDSIYKMRIAKLNANSPFNFVYNQDVRDFIDLYAVKKRQTTCRLLGLGEYYFPIFEEYLNKFNIPLEIKYLAVVESALIPTNKSWAAAAGLWQFIYSTGKEYGLNVTSYVDERYDPVKATIAACWYFNDLYSVYKDWSLVLAAYNSGAGNVNRAIRLANGETDFWKIKKYLPRETQTYVPAFIAVTYVMTYSSEHNLYPIEPDFLTFEIDTVIVKQKLTFDQLSEALNIPKENLEFLNPCYKEDIIPAFGDETYILHLPKKCVGKFKTNEAAIYAYKTKAMVEEEKLQAEKQKEIQKKDSLLSLQKQWTYKKMQTDAGANGCYIVQAGDGLGIIASKCNCSVSQLQEWNKLKDMNIFPGEKLYIQDPNKIASKSDSNSAKTVVKQNNQTQNSTINTPQNGKVKYIYHIVKQGDTLWGISSQYKGSSVEEIEKLNNLNDNSLLYEGQKLKIAIPI